MTNSKHKKISKFLSFVLRHKPDAIGLTLDNQGWVNIDELIEKSNQAESGAGVILERELLQAVVATNDKKRFIISEDQQSIRANQGHSIAVDLQLQPITPPEFLYHGTATRFLTAILHEGLKAQQRQHVHLSSDINTATAVGKRYGKPVILTVNALSMHEQGFVFYRSENGVWLTDKVPVVFISTE